MRERAVSDKLAQTEGGCREVWVPTGLVDVVTADEVIEVKHYRLWKAAIGQVLLYHQDLPHLKPRIHLYGDVDAQARATIRRYCQRLGIGLSWEEPGNTPLIDPTPERSPASSSSLAQTLPARTDLWNRGRRASDRPTQSDSNQQRP